MATKPASAAMLQDHAPNGVLLVPNSTAAPFTDSEWKHYRIFVRNINRLHIGSARNTKTTGRAITTPVPSTRRGFNTCNRVDLGLGNGYRGDAMKCD